MNKNTLITPDFGLDIREWVGSDGHKYKYIFQTQGRGKRTVQLKVSSFVGTCAIGAMHFYAKIKVARLDILDLTENKIYSLSGYGPNKPKEDGSLDIEATRRITKVERDMNDEVIGKIGEYTYRFNDAIEAARAGFKLLKEKFAGDWGVHYEGIDGGEYFFPLSEVEVSTEFYEKCRKECEKCFEE